MLKKLGNITKIRPDRVRDDAPPGQYVTEKFPVLTFGPTPRVDLKTWRFKVFGLVEEEVSFDWEEFTGLEKVTVDAEFHCVTQWSRLENTWEGVPFSAVLDAVRPKPEAKYAMVHCYGGYTTNVDLDVLQDDDVLFAYRHDGAPLPPDHGGPLCGWSCRSGTAGRARSGPTGWSCWPRTRPASGRRGAITCRATRGKRSGSDRASAGRRPRRRLGRGSELDSSLAKRGCGRRL